MGGGGGQLREGIREAGIVEPTQTLKILQHVGGCQNHGPFLGTLKLGAVL